MQASRSIFLILLSAGLIGCQQMGEQEPHPHSAAGSCNASAVQNLIGEQASPELLDRARSQSGATTARFLRPGDIVTLEYDARRLTLSTDETLEIQHISCG